MKAITCPCPACQKHAPLYPYFIRPVPKNDGMSHPRVVMQFHKSDDEAMQAALEYAPVYEWRMMSHDQVLSMYSGKSFKL